MNLFVSLRRRAEHLLRPVVHLFSSDYFSGYLVQNQNGVRVFIVASRDEAEDFTVRTATRYGTQAILVKRDGTPLLISRPRRTGARIESTSR